MTPSQSQETSGVDSLSGRRIRWKSDDGSMSGMNIEHSFNEDGSVTWQILDGQYKGATAREKSYGAVKVNERTWAISYLAASGHTLTVVLDLEDQRMIGFASNEKTWEQTQGRFEFVG